MFGAAGGRALGDMSGTGASNVKLLVTLINVIMSIKMIQEQDITLIAQIGIIHGIVDIMTWSASCPLDTSIEKLM